MKNRHFSAAQLLELDLPGMPNARTSLGRMIEQQGWRASPMAREGEDGWEYQLSLLPAEAQAELLRRELTDPSSSASHLPQGEKGSEAWAGFERLPTSARAAAEKRLSIVEQVMMLRGGGMKAGEAVALVSRRAEVSGSTLWGWLKLIEGCPRPHWLAALAPRHKGRTATVDCDPRAWDFLAADYLRAERPSFAACHRRLCEAAAVHGWAPIPSEKTLQRRLEALPAAVRTLARHGRDATAQMYPHQTRDRSGFAAMQAVNADGHQFDVFVRWDDGTVGRPVLVGVQDLATGKVLGHRLGQSESWALVRLAFADMVHHHGIPEQCWLDNGPAFASKWLTGGMKSRYRFTIKEDEPEGILTQLGIKVRWATPYHGQAKPIERAWRDLCEEIAKHPACAGAYTGNSPPQKPENYASRAVPVAAFRALVASEIARHNARIGRRGNGLNGESFDIAFARSLAAPGTIVTQATPAQRRLLLLAAEGVTCRKPTGEIQLGGNRYWAEALVEHRGRQVTVRFDPDDLHSAIAVYSRDGRLICEAPVIEATGFADQEAAQTHARGKRQWLKGQRDLLALEQRLGIAAVAGLLPAVAPQPAADPSVVRLFSVGIPGAPPPGLPQASGWRAPERNASGGGEAEAGANLSRAIRALAQDETDAGILPFPKLGAG